MDPDMVVLRYLSHPEVAIDPNVPVPEWSLSDLGRERAARGSAQAWVAGVTRVVSSPETKALETAEIFATVAGLDVEVRASIGEIDRSSTGYVSHDRHEELANQLFADPNVSASGWERAVDATDRMVGALNDVIDNAASDSVLVVGHGGVGTLLMCHLAGFDVARERDQPHGGCVWSYDAAERRLLHSWQPVDQ